MLILHHNTANTKHLSLNNLLKITKHVLCSVVQLVQLMCLSFSGLDDGYRLTSIRLWFGKLQKTACFFTILLICLILFVFFH